MLYSILFLKCPQCRQGKFLEAHPYKLSKMNKVKDHCPKCNLNYHIEPSFYTGSMYVSYGVGIAIAVAVFMLSIIFNIELGPKELLISIIVALIITMPYIGAVSKAIWAHLFIKYKPEIAKKVQNDKRT
ncbi:DUF983 domain-containing protein [Patiriisocius marinus]|uniref:DUF983 domain-containing protein n=1 Tax=Patiriisocius marinus TaxID=1397112 RepID=UPI00232EE451|nr:DUF983 domain-containing protein [Patiriisocius marinus]